MKQSGRLPVANGSIVKGTIIEVGTKDVLVDIGYKSEGVISGGEFEDLKTVKVGDVIDVLIEKLEDKEGMVVLSKEKAEFKQNWERILTICNEGGTIAGKVKAIVKGGLIVNIGVEAFLPASQIDVLTPKNLTQYVGNVYQFKVVKINQERQNIVLSRRELIEQERTERRQKLLAEMTPGDIRKGTVKNITDFGAFIDLNGIDGLLHITDMSWSRVGHPSEILKVGQDIDVVVLNVRPCSARQVGVIVECVGATCGGLVGHRKPRDVGDDLHAETGLRVGRVRPCQVLGVKSCFTIFAA